MGYYVELKNGKYKLYVEAGYDAKGRRKRKTRTVTATGKRQAQRLLRDFEEEVSNLMHLDDSNPTFLEFVERWDRNFAQVKLDPATREVYEVMLKPIENYFERKKIRDIKTMHIVEFFVNEEKEERGGLAKKYEVLTSIFKYAVKWQVIDENANPMDQVDRPKQKKRSANFYDKQEIELLFSLAKELLPYQQLIIKLAVTCAMRRGEIIAIAKDTCDFDNCKITVKRSVQHTKAEGLKLKETKTGEERVVTVPQKLMADLKRQYVKRLELRAEMGRLWKGFKDINGQEVFLLFGNEYGEPFNPLSVTQFFSRFLNRHEKEIKKVRFHDLRHSSASYILSQGVNMKIVQERLGHKNFKTTFNIYSHVTEEDDRKASDVFDELL